MPELTVLTYVFPNESASLAAYKAVMHIIAGGSAYRLHTPDGSLPPTLVVFAFDNVLQLRHACVAAGGTGSTIDPGLLRNLAERSLQAAQRHVVGRRHHAPGTPATENMPDNPEDYQPKE